MAGIFKAYDVRGLYPSEIDETTVRRIAYFTARLLDARRMVLGRDVRVSSPSLAEAAKEGLMHAGVEVLDIGTCTTPMTYFATVHTQADGAIQITASHNPPEYNGMKISGKHASAVGYHSGLAEVEKMVLSSQQVKKTGNGTCHTRSGAKEYVEHLLKATGGTLTKTEVVIDASNGAVCTVLPHLLDRIPVEAEVLFNEPDGRFPNHPPNPLVEENITVLKETVARRNAACGVAFDGDGDRCVIVDEKGRMLRGDMLCAILGREAVKRHGGGRVIYDLRCSLVVKEEVERAGGVAIRERVGHAFIKERMKKEDAVFGGEVAGHYYYKENFYADSGILTMLRFLQLLSSDGRRASDMFDEVNRYPNTGEINFEVEDGDALLEAVAEHFRDSEQDWLDGLTCRYPHWWFNLRKSNTEPKVRLIIEAKDEKTLQAGREALEETIRPFLK